MKKVGWRACKWKEMNHETWEGEYDNFLRACALLCTRGRNEKWHIDEQWQKKKNGAHLCDVYFAYSFCTPLSIQNMRTRWNEGYSCIYEALLCKQISHVSFIAARVAREKCVLLWYFLFAIRCGIKAVKTKFCEPPRLYSLGRDMVHPLPTPFCQPYRQGDGSNESLQSAPGI
jgi:hypothetical protein